MPLISPPSPPNTKTSPNGRRAKKNCLEVLGDVRVRRRDDGVFEFVVCDESHRQNGKWGDFVEGIIDVARREGTSGTPVEVYYAKVNGGKGRRVKPVDKKAYTLVYSSGSNGNGADSVASKGDMSKEQSTSSLSDEEREKLEKGLKAVLDEVQGREGEPTTQKAKMLEVFLAHLGQIVSREDFLSILDHSDDPDNLLHTKISQLRPRFKDQKIEIQHVPAYRAVLKDNSKLKKVPK